MPETYPVSYTSAEVLPVPEASEITESTGPTTLTVGAVADGEYLKRNGTTLVGDTPAGGGGLTSSSAIALLDSAAVNLNEGTGAKQPLYTVPASKIFIPMFLVYRGQSGGITVCEGTTGFNAGADDLTVASFNPTSDATKAGVWTPSTPVMGTAGQVLGLKVTVPEGSALTATVDVFGYLIAA